MNIFRRLFLAFSDKTKPTDKVQALQSIVPDISFHESGHVLLNKLFDEALSLRFVTLDYEMTKLNDPKSLGGVRAGFIVPAATRSILDYDKAALSFLAGFCVDELIKCEGEIRDNFFTPREWAPKITAYKYEGDLELTLSCFEIIKQITPLNWIDYFSSCLQILIEILSETVVWNTVCAIQYVLENSATKTLYSDEVDAIIVQTGFDVWRTTNKHAVIEKRRILLQLN